MKDITKILNANPSLAKELAKLLKEELETSATEVTDLTLPVVPAGTNATEVVPEAPAVAPIDNAVVAGEGHSTVGDLTAVDPITPEQVEQMVQELPVEDLEGEADALEEVKEEDTKEVEELDNVIEEATALKAKLQARMVFTEGIINKVNARILTEAAKLIASKKTLTEGKK